MDDLDNLFDCADADALIITKNPEDRVFLLSQRKKGRQGSMIGVDLILAGQEQRAAIRKEKEPERKRKHHEMMQETGTKHIRIIFHSCSQYSFLLEFFYSERSVFSCQPY